MNDYTIQTFGAYNRFTAIPELSYNIIKYLFKNENLMKLLYHDVPNALDLPDLTEDEKVGMIYNGEVESSQYRLFRTANLDDSFDKQVSLLRIFPYDIIPIDRVRASVSICIEIVNHVKLTYLDNYTQRYEYMFMEIMKSLNGADDIQGISAISFDANANRMCMSSFSSFNNKNYIGRRIFMNVFVSDANDGKC